MLNEQGNESHVSIQRMKSFTADQISCRLGSQRSIRDVDAKLRAQSEKARDQIIGLQYSVQTHLGDKVTKSFGRVAPSVREMVHGYPFLQQEFRLLGQSMGIVIIASLGDSRMDQRRRPTGTTGSTIHQARFMASSQQLEDCCQTIWGLSAGYTIEN